MSTEDTLRRWVREYGVRWQLSPLFEPSGRARVQTGYELELLAGRGGGTAGGTGGLECREVYERLRAIAFFALPQVRRPWRYEFAPFDTSLRLRLNGGAEDQVRLTLRLVLRQPPFDPRDSCEPGCAREIANWLRELRAEEEPVGCLQLQRSGAMGHALKRA